MAVAGCTKCIKYMLFFFNFIFWLAGGVILGVALWLRHDSQTSNLLILQFEGQQAPSTFYIIPHPALLSPAIFSVSNNWLDQWNEGILDRYIYVVSSLVITQDRDGDKLPGQCRRGFVERSKVSWRHFLVKVAASVPLAQEVRDICLKDTNNIVSFNRKDIQIVQTEFRSCVYILIAVGAVMMLVGFLGCYGAIQESQCLLGTFFFFLVILFASEVAAAIWGFMNKDTMSKELINFYDAAYIKAVDVSGSPSKDAAVSVLGAFHTTLNCCGKGDDTPLFTQVRNTLCPAGILSSPIPKSCHTELDALFSEKLYLIGLAALVVAVIMIFEMIFTMVLCCGIRNSPGVY